MMSKIYPPLSNVFRNKTSSGENYDDDCFAIIMARYTSKFPVSRFTQKKATYTHALRLLISFDVAAFIFCLSCLWSLAARRSSQNDCYAN
jgi:hypothetical protein